MQFKLGLIINPVAGLGGSVALKGSDGAQTAAKAIELGAQPKANSRAKAALEILLPYKEQLVIYTVNGEMGEQTAKALGFNVEVVYNTDAVTTPDDTESAAQVLKNADVDLVLFAGGDGTARNICHAIEDTVPVLGIPAGCKIHSGVYAITPKAAGRVVEMLVKGELVTLADADVMDIDEDAFRKGTVKAKRFGEMQIPSEVRYVQAVKNGGKETDELVLSDIAAYVVSEMDEDTLYIMGSGSTVEAIMEEMGLSIDPVREIAFEDTYVQLAGSYPITMKDYDGNDTVNFSPMLAIGIWLPSGKKKDHSKAFSVPTGNDGHTGLCIEGALNLDFLDTAAFSVGGGGTVFNDQTYDVFRVPNHRLQNGFYPWTTKVKRKPGYSWFGHLSMRSVRFISGTTFTFDYSYSGHKQDELTCEDSDTARADLFKTGLKLLDERSEWSSHDIHAGFTYEASQNIELGGAFHTNIDGTMTFRTNTLMGVVRFLF